MIINSTNINKSPLMLTELSEHKKKNMIYDFG